TARELLKSELILGGSSAGTLVSAALRLCPRPSGEKQVLTFLSDTSSKYLSKMYNLFLMVDQGFLEVPRLRDFRDLVSPRFVHDGRFFGLITRYDLLTYLRRSLP